MGDMPVSQRRPKQGAGHQRGSRGRRRPRNCIAAACDWEGTNRPRFHILIWSPLTMTTAASLIAARALTWREMVRFFRQRNRIVGSIGTPLVFWLLFGAGLSGSFGVGAGAAP